MSLEYGSVKGIMPRWRCDSCKTQKDGTCHSQRGMYNALFGGAGMGGFDGSERAIEEIFSSLERNCRQSALYGQEPSTPVDETEPEDDAA